MRRHGRLGRAVGLKHTSMAFVREGRDRTRPWRLRARRFTASLGPAQRTIRDLKGIAAHAYFRGPGVGCA